MAANNLKVLYRNLADSATITSTNTASGYPTTNTQIDSKGSAWRTASLISTDFILSWSAVQSSGINCIVLPYTNLSNNATITITCYSTASGTGTTVFQVTGLSTLQSSSGISDWNTANGINNYSFQKGSVFRYFFPTTRTDIRSIKITILDSSNSTGYVEISRVLIGNCWSPTYNTSFGVTTQFVDTSTHSRTTAGNIVTDSGPVYKTLSFELQYMSETDKAFLLQLIKLNGKRAPLWVSLFPSDGDPGREAVYQIYGKIADNVTISHPLYTQYVSSLTLEEV